MSASKTAPRPAEAKGDSLLDRFIRAVDSQDSLSQARDFLRQAAQDWRPDELPELAEGDLALAVATAWRTTLELQAREEPLVRLDPVETEGGERLPLDLLTIVQVDKPFLVDSVMGELGEEGFAVRAMFHPVVPLGGRDISSILVLLETVGEDRRRALMAGIRQTLDDVSGAVSDFAAMLDLMTRAANDLEASRAPEGLYGRQEYAAFLRWLTAGRFVFLGARSYEYPRLANGDYAAEEPAFLPEDGLGFLRDPSRFVLNRASEPAVLSSNLSDYLKNAPPLVVAKSNLRSRVNRRTDMDYVGVKRYDAEGRPFGEIRFVGLFTAEAYNEPAQEIPLIRSKIEHVLKRAAQTPSTHNEKRLRHIVEAYPRDELFQIEEDDLFRIATGIMHLSDRPRVRLFTRVDTFDRFVSVLLFIPRDRYDQNARSRAGEILARSYGGRIAAVYLSSSDQPLARLHFIVAVSPGAHDDPDPRRIEAEIADQVRTWSDRFEAVVRAGGVAPGRVGDILARYARAFPAGYRERYDADEALEDLQVIETLRAGDEETLRVRGYRRADDSRLSFRLKLYRAERFVALADVVPILEDMGLKTLTENGFIVKRAEPDGSFTHIMIHEFEVEDDRGAHLVFADVKAPFEETLLAVWTGATETDGFNRLVLELGISWREAALVRAVARYRQQSGLDPTQPVQEAALIAYPGVARLILDLFRTKFDPAISALSEHRSAQAVAISDDIVGALQDVESLDHDRALRRIAHAVRAMQRTNFYQCDAMGRPKPYIAFKIASRDLDDLPPPKPFREIFVWSPRVEGVHLRFGPVARGGLRWSDRRDDFRTEVLGLVKAQQVKNAVIVPVGAKGGFFPKLLPRSAGAEAIRTEAVEAYKIFLSGLLDITDNLDASGRVIRPPGLISHEGDDPYLVVAADKGTATFSDIANGVAEDYGFWLGDAFASGGSHGYDHKAMAITARGAWEAIKRHFRELGKDIQAETFTCVGVGDMSGDVFGNGMLLSKTTRLVAAFDHRHIFIDPDPEPLASWGERRRLFDLPASSWASYDPGVISAGGGVFARAAKGVALSPQASALLALPEGDNTPAEVMRAILKARVELLYLGGIGTYVKAASESNADVGDKANDAIRIDGHELRVQVVGEGANLGLTQAGRIAYARQGGPEGHGGRINTDAIDNSAGVDTSDHEVNIKILTNQAERLGDVEPSERDSLLVSMTDAVGAHVLAHNYAQTLGLSLQEGSAAADLEAQGRFMLDLEARGRLDRRVEGLPRAAAVADLVAAGRGLSRPELAVLSAYGKLELSDDIVASSAPDDPFFEGVLAAYFPSHLARFQTEMKRHRLRREIIATVTANSIVDMTGPTFASRLMRGAGCDVTALVCAFEAARIILSLDEAWRAIGALDLKVPAAAQLMLYRETARVLRGQTFWLARQLAIRTSPVQALVDAYRPTAEALRATGTDLLSSFEREELARRAGGFIDAGAPPAVSETVAALRSMTAAANIAEFARTADLTPVAAARLYHAVGGAYGFDRLRTAAQAIHASDPYEHQALRGLILELVHEQRRRSESIAVAVKEQAEAPADEASVRVWVDARTPGLGRARQVIQGIEESGAGWSFAKLTIATGALRNAGPD